MATHTVNLDAMIARDDMATENGSTRPGSQSRTTMSILDLDGGFFATGLRKPDFQRETTQWSPPKVLDLISAFVSGDLIPAVILWQRGADTFVIDGAHRLSALLAWIHDDYGDRAKSIGMFGAQMPNEQLEVAERTRRLVNKSIGAYSKFKGLAASQSEASSKDRSVIEGLRNNSFVVQWVPASDSFTAEKSFFKINQAAQPIDPTERRILQSRTSASAIAARCIVRGGKGHSYWGKFSDETQHEIQTLGKEIYDALFRPDLTSPISTLDLPVAGSGYNQLPFAFDLTNLCNDIPLPERSDTQKSGREPATDPDGVQTLEFLKSVRRRVRLITTKDPSSLGLHPAVYCYAMSGNFMPNAFLATSEFAMRLLRERKLREFTKSRQRVEDYIFDNKVFVSLTVTKLGSGSRSLDRLASLYWSVFQAFHEGKNVDQVSETLFSNPDFAYLIQAKAPPPRSERGATGKMSGSTKSAVSIRHNYPGAPRCGICGAAVHFRSLSIDHIQRKRDGGSGEMHNGQVTHPFCNTGFKA